MKTPIFIPLVDEIDESLVDKSTNNLPQFIYDLAKLKESMEYADIIETVNGYKPNIKELYYEMWIHN